MEKKLCPKCGKKLNLDDIFCGFCGCDTTKVDKKLCPKCKEWIPLEYDFCPKCGWNINETPELEPKSCSKCETLIPQDGSFCPKCGWNTNEIYNSAQQIPQNSPKTPRKMWKIWLPIAIIAVIIGAIAIVKSCSDSKTFIVNGVPFKMIYVQGGTFTMGATYEQGNDAYYGEEPTHNVTLSDYYIAETEVTQELWKAVMETDIGQQRDRINTYWKLVGEGENYPMYYVSWDDCQEFIQKLNHITGKNFRLPTEAEWEYAARGGNKSCGYKYAGCDDIGEVAWYLFNGDSKTHPVKSKKSNELGLYDMSGNVWEWCQDWYDDYTSNSQTNPQGPSSGWNRVLRGGSWTHNTKYCRISSRYSSNPDYACYFFGFRLVLVP